ncbi:lytic transglycosylase domain-containing protein [Candidatus Magnetoovum chiemensis]|nr:lytic transglycosylase domain-containing protein [Candidatus Magnetoovum chiemensis]
MKKITVKEILSFIVCLSALFVSSLDISAVYAEEPYDSLKKGKTALDNKSYQEAVVELDSYIEKDNLLGDYALLWRARAYYALKELKKALFDISLIKNLHPDSPLRRKAERLEIDITKDIDIANCISLTEDFLEKHSDDDSVRFIYGQLLEQTGKTENAKQQYLNLYLGGGTYAKASAEKIDLNSLTSKDMLERGKNLIKRYYYKTAYDELIKALSIAPENLTKEINEQIAISLFKQKRYSEAAQYYKNSDDSFMEARSYYRSNDMNMFKAQLERLVKMNHSDAPSLQLAYGQYLRRQGDINSALAIFKHLEADRSLSQEAMWNSAWTYYLNKREYKTAYAIFKTLYDKHGKSQYLYWMAKSYENSGDDASYIYNGLLDINDFYTTLAYLRNGKKAPYVRAMPTEELETKDIAQNKSLKRLDIVLKLGINEAVEIESVNIFDKSSNLDIKAKIKAGKMLKKAQDYRRAILLAGRVPYTYALQDILYPNAFMDDVNLASKKFNANPYVLLSIIRAESLFQPDALSAAGALGLMQLMPDTARRYQSGAGVTINDDADILNVRNNIMLGTYYFTKILDGFKCVPAVFASYNAGETVVQGWIDAGNYVSQDEFIEDIPYDETREYVKRIIKTYFQYLRMSDHSVSDLQYVVQCSF